MRVLFHADLSHGQAAAVWRCRHLLEGMGIELVQEDYKRDTPPCDLWLVHTPIVDDEWIQGALSQNRKLVLLERIDGAQLSAPVRKYIGHPNLKAVIKNTVYADWTRYNESAWRGHELRCQLSMGNVEKFPEMFEIKTDGPPMEIGPRLLPESKWITREQAAKLRLGFSFVAYPHYDAFREITPSWILCPDKIYDLHFAGTTDYGPELPWLNWHRQKAVEAIRRTGREAICHDSRVYNFHEYFEGMKRSRFVVSPWGLGEPCYRDFEAILCGCMVIKPDTSYIKTVPSQFYQIPPFSRCVCKPDFSDLEDVLAKVEEISIGDKVQWAQWLLKENSSEAIARRLAKIFREAIS